MTSRSLRRRQYLAALAGSTISAVAGCNTKKQSSTATKTQSTDSPKSTPTPRPSTPTRPDSPTIKESNLILEFYGELDLNEDQRYWAQEIIPPSSADCVLLEYSVDAGLMIDTNDFADLDVFLLGDHYPEYTEFAKWEPICIFGHCLNTQKAKSFSAGNIEHKYAWSRVDGGTLTKRVLVPSSRSHVVFDGTAAPGVQSTSEVVSEELEVSLRVSTYSFEDAEEIAVQTVQDLIDQLPADFQELVSNLRTTSEKLCNRDSIHNLSSHTVAEAGNEVGIIGQVSTALADVFEIIESRYSITLPSRPLSALGHISKWGGKRLPIIGSAIRLAKSACSLGTVNDNAEVSKLKSKAKRFFLSLVILIADVLMVWSGIITRVGTALVSAADYFLLGYLRRIVGLRFYVVILKNLLFLFEEGITSVISNILEISKEISESTTFISSKDLRTLQNLNQDNISDWRQLGFLNEDKACGTVLSSSTTES